MRNVALSVADMSTATAPTMTNPALCYRFEHSQAQTARHLALCLSFAARAADKRADAAFLEADSTDTSAGAKAAPTRRGGGGGLLLSRQPAEHDCVPEGNGEDRRRKGARHELPCPSERARAALADAEDLRAARFELLRRIRDDFDPFRRQDIGCADIHGTHDECRGCRGTATELACTVASVDGTAVAMGEDPAKPECNGTSTESGVSSALRRMASPVLLSLVGQMVRQQPHFSRIELAAVRYQSRAEQRARAHADDERAAQLAQSTAARARPLYEGEEHVLCTIFRGGGDGDSARLPAALAPTTRSMNQYDAHKSGAVRDNMWDASKRLNFAVQPRSRGDRRTRAAKTKIHSSSWSARDHKPGAVHRADFDDPRVASANRLTTHCRGDSSACAFR